MDQKVINWLLDGDVSIQYQTYRDLLDQDRPALQQRIAQEGWGAHFLSCQKPDGSWGQGFFQPGWMGSHYILLDLKQLAIAPNIPAIRQVIHPIACQQKSPDGGINPDAALKQSDVCVNGLFLNYACYFGEPQPSLNSIVDFLLQEQMADGGFNCRRNRSGARHSSLHSTLSVLEGILSYARRGYTYRLNDLTHAAAESREFILQHRLFKSDRTGEIICNDFLKLSYPPRWKYNILRSLDYFQAAQIPWDSRMQDALDVLLTKRSVDGRWPRQAAHPGKVHFTMEPPRQPSRWNTLIALRVLKAYENPPNFLTDSHRLMTVDTKSYPSVSQPLK